MSPTPGQTITPDDKSNSQTTPDTNMTAPPVNSGANNQITEEPPTQWQFNPVEENTNNPAVADNATSPNNQIYEPVSWSASEFIAHKKSAGWYLMLGIGSIILAAIVYLLTRDKISTGVVLFAAIILGSFGARQPRTLNYQLDNDGIKIGEKSYKYSMFKYFSVIDDGAFSSIVLVPLRRFVPAFSIYYDPKDEKKITNILANRLPFNDHKDDMVEGFMKRIRF